MSGDDLSGVELRHLRALIAIADTSSFSRAGARLGYAQSAISQQIAALERAVGVRLIERPGGPRAVTLSEAGEILVRHARSILAGLGAARADLAALAAGEAGMLRLGTFQSAGARILPEVLGAFRREMPLVELRMTEENDEERLLDLVATGDLDVVFCSTTDLDARFESVELVLDRWFLLAPPDSPLAGLGRVPLKLLDGLPMITWVTNRPHASIDREIERVGAEPVIVFRTDDNLTLQRLVGTGLGYAFAPGLGIEHGPGAGPAVVLALDAPIPPRRIALVWRRDRVPSRASEVFAAAAQQVVASGVLAAPAAA